MHGSVHRHKSWHARRTFSLSANHPASLRKPPVKHKHLYISTSTNSSVHFIERPMFAYANSHWKTHLKIHFIYSDNKEIYRFFKTFWITPALFSTKCHLFHNFIFFCSNNTFFTNHVLEFKHPPW